MYLKSTNYNWKVQIITVVVSKCGQNRGSYSEAGWGDPRHTRHVLARDSYFILFYFTRMISTLAGTINFVVVILSGHLSWSRFWFWFLNLIFEYVVVIPCLAHAQNIYLFILKILFSLDQIFRVECVLFLLLVHFNLILYEHFSFCFASSYLYELLILV